jgi:hypothetical protein
LRRAANSLPQRRRAQPSPPSRRLLCRAWSELNSSEITLRPLLPWLSQTWGGMRRAFSRTAFSRTGGPQESA